MKILITGGFGYIGARLAQYLFEQKHEILLGTRFEVDSPAWLPKAAVTQICWDDQEYLDTACDGVDMLIHAAGMNASDCDLNPVAALEFNGVCTAKLLDAAIRQKVRRFIYISTAHVYSSPLVGTINEETRLTNLHPYATSHRAGEDVVLRANQLGIIEGIVARLSNAFGAPAHVSTPCWSLLVNDLCRQAVTTQKMKLNSSGIQRRDFVSLFDVCRVIEHLLHLPKYNIHRGLFNIGGEWTPTVLEMATFIQQQCEHVLDFRPQLSCLMSQSGEVSDVLEYRSEALSQSGFQLRADYTLELRNLLEFCRISFR